MPASLYPQAHVKLAFDFRTFKTKIKYTNTKKPVFTGFLVFECVFNNLFIKVINKKSLPNGRLFCMFRKRFI